jgi:hypothetical protein
MMTDNESRRSHAVCCLAESELVGVEPSFDERVADLEPQRRLKHGSWPWFPLT